MSVARSLEETLTAVLRHSWTMAVKTRARDALWAVRGFSVRNPRPPIEARTLLFVCKGNICRSAFAERAATRLLPAHVRCLSAGFRANAGMAPPPTATEVAARHGVSLVDHRATSLTPALMDGADMVLVMEVWHVRLLRLQYPQHHAKILLLPLYDPARSRASGYDRVHIADPYGKSPAVFDACFTRLERTLAALGQTLQTVS